VVQVLVLMFEILIHPEVFSVVLVFIIVFVLITLIPRRKKSEDTMVGS
jgi:Ca2+/Na+ antiporter